MVHSYDHSKLESSSWCKKHDFGSSHLRNTYRFEDRTQSKKLFRNIITRSCCYDILTVFRLCKIFIPFCVPKMKHFLMPKRAVYEHYLVLYSSYNRFLKKKITGAAEFFPSRTQWPIPAAPKPMHHKHKANWRICSFPAGA